MTATLLKSFFSPKINHPTIHQLPNGLTIVAEQIPIEAVSLNVWVNVGSAAESNDINGMAHFLEHIVFKGTYQLENGEFERRIEEKGAVTNAATSQDYTHFYITTAPNHFSELAPLQIDVVCNPLIEANAFERERLVVLEEIRRSEDNVRRRTYHRAMELAFEKLPYRRPVLGPASVIENLTPQQMRDFHNLKYQPNAITAVAVGNLPTEELIEIVTDSFTKAQSFKSRKSIPSDQCLIYHQPETPFPEITRREFVDDSLQQARLVMVWRVPGLTQLQETYPLDILAAILGQGRTSRLIRDLREDRGLVSHISVSNMTNYLQGTFCVIAHLPEENIPEVEKAIVQHIRTIQAEFATETEIARVRTQVANRFVFANETPSDRSGMYGYYQSMVGDLAPALNYPARIQSIDAFDLQQTALRYLPPDAYGVVVIKPR